MSPSRFTILAAALLAAQPPQATPVTTTPVDSTTLLPEWTFTTGIEGPAVGPDGRLYAVNFAREGTIGVVTPDGRAELFVTLPPGSTGNGIRFGPRGGKSGGRSANLDFTEVMYVADYTGHNVLAIDPSTRDIRVFAHEPRMNQPNDLAIGPDGRLYASDPDWKAGTGQLWRIDPDGTVTRLETGMGTTNGIEVSPDGRRLYVNESVQRNVWVYDLSPSGAISDKRLLIRFDDFSMDGMRCDVEGTLYITRHGKGTIAKVSPDGKLLREYRLTGTKPSNVAFGGDDGRTLYVMLQDHGTVETLRVDAPGREWKMMRGGNRR
ncbi:MAG TPA: SMP-30/gluconolactonase/LRE family protein [Vicinamibacterales bacterium]